MLCNGNFDSVLQCASGPTFSFFFENGNDPTHPARGQKMTIQAASALKIEIQAVCIRRRVTNAAPGALQQHFK
jgi:hypothetical protein